MPGWQRQVITCIIIAHGTNGLHPHRRHQQSRPHHPCPSCDAMQVATHHRIAVRGRRDSSSCRFLNPCSKCDSSVWNDRCCCSVEACMRSEGRRAGAAGQASMGGGLCLIADCSLNPAQLGMCVPHMSYDIPIPMIGNTTGSLQTGKQVVASRVCGDTFMGCCAVPSCKHPT